MKPDLFLADLEEKPSRLAGLALRDARAFIGRPRLVLLLGMGSSHYANLVVAARMRELPVNNMYQKNVAIRIEDKTHWLSSLTEDGLTLRSTTARADEVSRWKPALLKRRKPTSG